ncbi:hypothetical protein EYF80_057468 [Liparis tanakae]|uniref:Uncharacterized protein n=1 Tax=Liparis tanakae TaxID=230148 RepID=A0A4Z2EVW2_9TELE|nr:hypothetical protein EYF80_057468 [Liparis tanakae]
MCLSPAHPEPNPHTHTHNLPTPGPCGEVFVSALDHSDHDVIGRTDTKHAASARFAPGGEQQAARLSNLALSVELRRPLRAAKRTAAGRATRGRQINVTLLVSVIAEQTHEKKGTLQ